MTIGIKMTAKQFLMLGEDPPGTRLELVHGDIIVSPSPSFEHGYTDRHLSALLIAHIKQHSLGDLSGDVDTIFSSYDVRRPDIIFLATPHAKLRDPKKHGVVLPPDLCIEIVSPGSVEYDETDKFDLYLEQNVPNYWLVNPTDRTFIAYKLTRKRYVKIASGVNNDVVSAEPFPKLKIPLSEIWAPTRRI